MTDATETTEDTQEFGLDEDAFVAAYEGRVTTEEDPKPSETVETPETEPQEPQESDEADESPQEPEESFADDEHLVAIKVGDEDRKVAVKDLKALYDQRESLPAKVKEAEEKVSRANQEGERAVVVLDGLMKRAQERFAPYAKVDFAIAAQRLDEGAYQQLKKDYQEAYAEVNYIQAEADQLLTTIRGNRQAAVQEALKACDTALAADPETKGWDQSARKELSDYAVAQGLPKALVETLSDPAAIKLIRKAMAFDRGTKSVKDAVQTVAKTKPKTPIRPGTSDGTSSSSDRARSEAMARLRKSGSMDDAEAAFLARLS